MAGIHGDEPESTALLSEALRHLEPNELENAIILCANPDGLSNGTRANTNGVDLNRNFPSSNWRSDSVYYRNTKNEERDIELNPGLTPASEPETKSLIDIIEKLKPQYLISIHGALACIEDPTKSSMSKWIAKQTKLPLVEDVGYPTPGSLGSWAAENEITIITYELPSISLIEIKKTFTPVLIKLLTNSWDS
jgi:protein MpaA